MAPQDVHEFATMSAGLIDVTNEYLQEKEYPYEVMMVKPAQDLMLWTPGTVLVVLEPIEKKEEPTEKDRIPPQQAQTGVGK